jgi:acyl dehydratase
MSVPPIGWTLPPFRIDPVDPERMKVMALLLHDPNPIHFDPASVTSLGPDPRVINQGPISLGYVVTMLTGALGDRARITSVACRYLANVRAVDAVSVGGELVALTPLEGGATSATFEVWLDIDGGERALVGTATVTLHDDDTDFKIESSREG